MHEKDHDILIHPRRGSRENPLPARALMLTNPAEARYGVEVLVRQQARSRSLYNSQLLVDRAGCFCLAGPALGAPAAGLVLEKLIVLGVTEIVLVSCCGAVDPAFTIGDILVGISSVSGVGLTRYYTEELEITPRGQARRVLAKALDSNGLEHRDGVIWSTDAPYRERRSELLGLQEEYGIAGVDMEYAALCAICALRGVSLAGVFVVSDILWGSEWHPGFTSESYKRRSRHIIDTIISHLSSEKG